MLLFLGFIRCAAAASDGTVGATSTGTANLSISIPGFVIIKGVANISLGTWSGSGDLSANDNVCVYTNLGTAKYRVTATGNGSSNAFTVSATGNSLPYKVYWNQVTGTTGQVELTSGQVLLNQTTSNNSSSACAADTANFQITILSSDLLAARPGAYTGNVTFLIEPG
jgi:hypothetical protein